MAMALLWAVPAGATDLRLSLGVQGEYDSNVFHRDSQIEDDFVLFAIPRIMLLETEGKFTYDFGYEFPYQHTVKTNALNHLNHIVRTGADYHLSDRTQFSFSDRFAYVEALSDNFEDQPPNIGDNERNQTVLRNRASFGLTHRFTPRLSNRTDFDQDIHHTTQENRSDNRSYSLGSDLNYLLTERQTLGGGFHATFQDFDGSDDDPASHTFFVGPRVSWSYQIDEQSVFRLGAGPSYVYSKRQSDAGLGFPESDSDSRIAVLGNASIDRRWSPAMTSGLSYQRHQDTASGVAGSAILDAVALTHTWAVTERWSLAGRADWTQRKSATDVETGDDDLDTQRWGAGAVAAYRISRNLTGSVRYQYSKQRSQGGTAGRFSDFEAHIATLGFDYALDPIEVW
jgi:hypothetical protein